MKEVWVMKKFEAPELQELNINETSYWYQGWYDHGHGGGHGGHGNNSGHGNNGGHGGNGGCGNGKPGTGSDGDNFFDSLS